MDLTFESTFFILPLKYDYLLVLFKPAAMCSLNSFADSKQLALMYTHIYKGKVQFASSSSTRKLVATFSERLHNKSPKKERTRARQLNVVRTEICRQIDKAKIKSPIGQLSSPVKHFSYPRSPFSAKHVAQLCKTIQSRSVRLVLPSSLCRQEP